MCGIDIGFFVKTRFDDSFFPFHPSVKVDF